MIAQLQDFAAGFPSWASWTAVLLISAIPFVESYFGSAIGIAIGLPAGVAVAAAVAGNVASMLGFVLSADRARSALRRRQDQTEAEPAAPKRVRLRRLFDRFGVPGVSLLGQTVLPSQITSATMVGFGARTRSVISWQIVSIVLWGVVFAALASAGVDFVASRS